MKLYKFYADWCGPCKMMDMVINGAKDKLGVEVVNINIDENLFFAQQYQVRSVPTFILFDDTDKDNLKEVKRKTGTMNETQLLEFVGE